MKKKITIISIIIITIFLIISLVGLLIHYTSLIDLNDKAEITKILEDESISIDSQYDIIYEKDYAVLLCEDNPNGTMYEIYTLFFKRDKIFHSMYTWASGCGKAGTELFKTDEDYSTFSISTDCSGGINTEAIAVTVTEFKAEKENPIDKIVITRVNLESNRVERIEVDVTEYPFHYLYVDETPANDDSPKYIYTVSNHRLNDN